MTTAAQVIFSFWTHAEALIRKLDAWLMSGRDVRPHPCPLCGGEMILAGRSKRLDWFRCTSCRRSQEGIQV